MCVFFNSAHTQICIDDMMRSLCAVVTGYFTSFAFAGDEISGLATCSFEA